MTAGTSRAVGPYLVGEPFARGSTAELCLAHARSEPPEREPFVLKWLAPHLVGDRVAERRLRHEGLLLARFAHENVVAARGAGELEGRPFVALELVRGRTLEAWLAACLGGLRPPLPVIAALVADAAAGLEHAHAARAEGRALCVVHRDLCPENVVVRQRDGCAKVIDFGLATSTLAPDAPTGAVLGTVAYAAPEQLGGGVVDHRADVFSLGVILHELLSGARLFRRASLAATTLAVVEAEIPPPSASRADVPRELDAIVSRALARDRGQRTGSAGALGDSLRPWCREGRAPVRAFAGLWSRGLAGDPEVGA